MKKIILTVVSVLVLALLLCSCGSTYTCCRCGDETTKAYYQMNADKNNVMCEDCARSYWMPLDYESKRVK